MNVIETLAFSDGEVVDKVSIFKGSSREEIYDLPGWGWYSPDADKLEAGFDTKEQAIKDVCEFYKSNHFKRVSDNPHGMDEYGLNNPSWEDQLAHERMRIESMHPSQLLRRLDKITKHDKLMAFYEALATYPELGMVRKAVADKIDRIEETLNPVVKYYDWEELRTLAKKMSREERYDLPELSEFEVAWKDSKGEWHQKELTPKEMTATALLKYARTNLDEFRDSAAAYLGHEGEFDDAYEKVHSAIWELHHRIRVVKRR